MSGVLLVAAVVGLVIAAAGLAGVALIGIKADFLRRLRQRRDDADRRVLEAVERAGTPLYSPEIGRATGFRAWRTISTLSRLVERGELNRHGRNLYTRPPNW